MGKSSTNTTTSSSQPNPIVQGAATDIARRASDAINTLTPEQLVPDPTPRMGQAWDLTGAVTGNGDPNQIAGAGYLGTAASTYGSALTPYYEQIPQYMSPYIQSVVDATQNQFNNQNAIQQQGIIGNAVSRGAWGGDRSAVAQAITAGQQQLAQAPVIAGLYNQGYNTALGALEAQDWQRLQAGQAYAGLAPAQLGLGLTAAQALYGAGQQQYGQMQARNTVPLQIPQYEAGLLGTVSGSLGGTSSTTSPGASPLSQIAGLGIGGVGLLGATGGFGANGYLSNLFGGGAGADLGTGGPYRHGGRIGYYAPGGIIGSGINAPNSFNFNSADPFDFATAPVPHAMAGSQNPLAPITSTTQKQESGGGLGILGDILGVAKFAAPFFGARYGGPIYASGGAVDDDDFQHPRGGFMPIVFRSGIPSRGGGIGIPAPPAPYHPDAASTAITPSGIMGTLKDTGAFGDKGWMKDVGNTFAGGGLVPGRWDSYDMPPLNTGAALSLLDARLGPDGTWGDYRDRDLPRYDDGGTIDPAILADAGVPPAAIARIVDMRAPRKMVAGIAPPDAGLDRDLPAVSDDLRVMPGTPDAAAVSGPSGEELTPLGQRARAAYLVSAETPKGGGIAPAQRGRSEADIIASESGGRPYVGYGGSDLSRVPLDENGFPIWQGKMGPAGISHAAGLYQFQPGTWAEGAKALGITDFSPESQKRVFDWTRAKYGDAPWAASAGDPGAGRRGIAGDRMAGMTAADAGGGDAPAVSAGIVPRASSLSPIQMEDLIASVKPNPWLALAAAGFGMAAGRSPQAMQNIGAGALEGLKSYEAQRLAQPKLYGEAAEAVLKGVQAQKVIGAMDILSRPTATTADRVGAIDKMIADAAPKSNAAPNSVARPDGSVVPIPSAANPAPVTAPQGQSTPGLTTAGGTAVPTVPAVTAADSPEVRRAKEELETERSLVPFANDPAAALSTFVGHLQALPGYRGAVAATEASARLPSEFALIQERARTELANAAPLEKARVAERPEKYIGADGRERVAPLGQIAAGTAPGMAPPTAGLVDPRTGQAVPGSTGISGPVVAFEPGEREERSGQGATANKEREAILTQAESARGQYPILNSLGENAQRFWTGPMNELVGEVKRVLNVVNPEKYGETVAAREQFLKDQGVLTRTATHDVSPRAGIQEVQFIQKSLPNPDMSPRGIQQVVNELKGLNDYKVAKAQALQQFMQARGGAARGFEDWWSASAPVTPYTYVVARMDPQQRQALYRDMGRTAEGRAYIQNIVKEQTYAQQHGWMGLQQ